MLKSVLMIVLSDKSECRHIIWNALVTLNKRPGTFTNSSVILLNVEDNDLPYKVHLSFKSSDDGFLG